MAVHIEEPTREEIDAAMRERDALDRDRIFRDAVNAGDCGFCHGQNLRLVWVGGRYALTCKCGFKEPP